ncbi:uncharacterized protein B0I36DRAFT_366614 [Microdochium trichocladiopsis]|uniref:Uncharacterized protein n=1 Tax=Microdochium trichocladiopsis TaxID=1682393 RepID=A0A9P8XWT5_9PEZI|nr:uncharacterized protein B0I36DRAFT_366614 [Microdochium trichocladiopsis]KAH7024689.1 hypothetical protein B0I36DRAFT_366614 [Microdochium trichocladiopsis]
MAVWQCRLWRMIGVLQRDGQQGTGQIRNLTTLKILSVYLHCYQISLATTAWVPPANNTAAKDGQDGPSTTGFARHPALEVSGEVDAASLAGLTRLRSRDLGGFGVLCFADMFLDCTMLPVIARQAAQQIKDTTGTTTTAEELETLLTKRQLALLSLLGRTVERSIDEHEEQVFGRKNKPQQHHHVGAASSTAAATASGYTTAASSPGFSDASQYQVAPREGHEDSAAATHPAAAPVPARRSARHDEHGSSSSSSSNEECVAGNSSLTPTAAGPLWPTAAPSSVFPETLCDAHIWPLSGPSSSPYHPPSSSSVSPSDPSSSSSPSSTSSSSSSSVPQGQIQQQPQKAQPQHKEQHHSQQQPPFHPGDFQVVPFAARRELTLKCIPIHVDTALAGLLEGVFYAKVVA